MFIIIAVHSWGLLVQRVLVAVRSCGNPQQITNILRRRHYGNTDIAAVSSRVLHARNIRGSSYKASNSNTDLGEAESNEEVGETKVESSGGER